MIDVSQYVKLLPYSLKQDPVVVAMFEAVVIQLKEAYDEADALYDLVRIDNLPEQLLDLLAYEKHVDFYDHELTVQQKRDLIKTSVSWHRHKGTRWAVEHVTSIVYKNAEVFEWFEYGGEKYRFCIYIDEPFITSKDMSRLLSLIEATKNKRSWLEYVAILLRMNAMKLHLKTYSFDVPYRICNTFQTETLPGKLAQGLFAMKQKSYLFNAYTPICGTFVTSTINSVQSNLNVELSNKYRDIEVLYKRAGQAVIGEGEI